MTGSPTQVAWLSFMGLKRPAGTVPRTPSLWEASLQPREAAAIEAQTAPLGGREGRGDEGSEGEGGERESQ